jgi:hypothetical protein
MRAHKAIEIDVQDGVAIHHHEARCESFENMQYGAGRPTGFSFGDPRYPEIPRRTVAAEPRNLLGAVAAQQDDIAESGFRNKFQLPSEQRFPADIDQRLGPVSRERPEAGALTAY